MDKKDSPTEKVQVNHRFQLKPAFQMPLKTELSCHFLHRRVKEHTKKKTFVTPRWTRPEISAVVIEFSWKGGPSGGATRRRKRQR